MESLCRNVYADTVKFQLTVENMDLAEKLQASQESQRLLTKEVQCLCSAVWRAGLFLIVCCAVSLCECQACLGTDQSCVCNCALECAHISVSRSLCLLLCVLLVASLSLSFLFLVCVW